MIYEAIGVYSKSPYHIPELAVSVHSFEELCHVLVEKYYDIGEYIMADELISFIGDDLALHDLADELRGARSSLTEYTKVLLSYRRYMSDEGVETVLKGISSGGETKEYVRLISRGDYLITHRKYRPAILLYEHARELMDKESERDGIEYRELLIKLGRLYALYFMFDKASEAFSMAGDKRRTLFCRKLAMSRVDFTDMMMKDDPGDDLRSEIENLTVIPQEIEELKESLREGKTYGAQLASERISTRLKAEYRRML